MLLYQYFQFSRALIAMIILHMHTNIYYLIIHFVCSQEHNCAFLVLWAKARPLDDLHHPSIINPWCMHKGYTVIILSVCYTMYTNWIRLRWCIIGFFVVFLTGALFGLSWKCFVQSYDMILLSYHRYLNSLFQALTDSPQTIETAMASFDNNNSYCACSERAPTTQLIHQCYLL